MPRKGIMMNIVRKTSASFVNANGSGKIENSMVKTTMFNVGELINVLNAASTRAPVS